MPFSSSPRSSQPAPPNHYWRTERYVVFATSDEDASAFIGVAPGTAWLGVSAGF
jgi:hypothetical protein